MKGLTKSFWAFAILLVTSGAFILWSHFGRSAPVTPSPLKLEAVLKLIYFAAIYSVIHIAFVFAVCALVAFVPQSRIRKLLVYLMRFGLLAGALVATVATAAFASMLWPDRKVTASGDFALPVVYLILVGISGGVSFLAWRLFLKSLKPVDAVFPPPINPTGADRDR